MQKVKYIAVFLLYCTLFSCSDIVGSTSDVDNTGGTFQAYTKSVYNNEKYGENSIYHDSYLVIENGEEQQTYEISGSYFSDELYLCDIDGDSYNEIVVQQLVGISGGAGQYHSYIFKYENNEIIKMFDSVTGNKFDTGFSSILKDNYKVEISNAITGYKTEIDYYENPIYYNDDGTVAEDRDWLMVDNFREFKPEDIDNDGIYEILCLQYSSLCGHTDYIGDAQSYLKYNSDNKQFEVVKVDFIPHNGGENKLTFS